MAKRAKADVNRAIDLLWSHQIRRENAALHKETKRLQQQVLSQADEAREWHTVSQKAQAAAAAANVCAERVLIDQKALQTAVDTANRQAENAAQQVSILQANLQEARASETQLVTQFNEEMGRLRAELSRFQDQSKLDVNQMGTALHHILTRLDEKQNEVDLRRLHNRVSQLEASLLERPNLDSLSRIEDSIEEQHCDGHCDDNNPFGERLALQKPDPGAASAPQATADEVAEPMLILRDPVSQDAPTEPEEIDLDENVATMSYARSMWRDKPITDSLVMLPEPYSQLVRDADAGTLKQGRFQSWDNYFDQGAAVMREIPRRYESNVVRSFVEGLYATKQRGQCEQWLDLEGWTWESIAAFGLSGTPSVPMGMGNVDGQKTKTTAKVSEKRGGSNKLDGGTPTMRSKSHKARQQKDNISAEESIDTSGPRRSQRVKDLSQPSRSLMQPVTQRSKRQPTKTSQKQEDKKLKKAWQRPRNEKGRFDQLQSPSRSEQPPSTPVRQRTPNGHEQALPRLVKRKRSVGPFRSESSKKRRLMDEEGLLPLVQPANRLERQAAKFGRRRRSPLPPPPEIPIMPTSDD